MLDKKSDNTLSDFGDNFLQQGKDNLTPKLENQLLVKLYERVDGLVSQKAFEREIQYLKESIPDSEKFATNKQLEDRAERLRIEFTQSKTLPLVVGGLVTAVIAVAGWLIYFSASKCIPEDRARLIAQEEISKENNKPSTKRTK